MRIKLESVTSQDARTMTIGLLSGCMHPPLPPFGSGGGGGVCCRRCKSAWRTKALQALAWLYLDLSYNKIQLYDIEPEFGQIKYSMRRLTSGVSAGR